MPKKTNDVKTKRTTRIAESKRATVRLRSPNYPSVGLRQAISYVTGLVEKDGRAGSPTEAAARHMGFSKLHGQARAVLSALKKFNLIDYRDDRVVPTEEAVIACRLPEGNARRHGVLRLVALRPSIYQEVVKRYAVGGELPSDETLGPEIAMDLEFNPKAVGGFLRDFRDSLTFAGVLDGNRLLLEGITLGDEPQDDDEDREVDMRTESPLRPPTSAPTLLSVQPSSSPKTSPSLAHVDTGSPTIRVDLARGNFIEIRMRERVSREEFQRLKKVFDMAEITFVEETPMTAEVSMILDQGLTADEKAKLKRLDGQLAAVFASAGQAVRTCQGIGDGDARSINFMVGLFGPVIVSIPATQFVSAPDETILSQVQRTLRG